MSGKTVAKKSSIPSKEQYDVLRDLFREIASEIDEQKKKKPDGVMNSFKVERVNKVLRPLYDLMKNEPYAEFLELIPEPAEERVGRTTVADGLSYSDVAIIICQYRGAMTQYYHKYFNGIDFNL